MNAKRKAATTPVVLGIRAIRGGGVAVGVALDGREPRVVISTLLATAAEGDRLAFEPYHVAVEMCPGGKVTAAAKAAVAKGRKRQDELAANGLAEIVRKLESEGSELAGAVLLVNRAGWMDDLLAYSLAFADHPPVAEGLAVREALRSGFKACGIAFDELDEKSLPDLADKTLRAGAGTEARLKALGAGLKPWRKEQKLACLAAWVSLAGAR